jgi:transposase-like protein
MQQRERYSGEFKHETVGLTREPGGTILQIARAPGIHASQLQRWRHELDVHGKISISSAGVCAMRKSWRSSANWPG